MPTKPADLDIEQIREDLRIHYAKVRKVPGEPLLYFNLIEESGSITINTLCSS